MPRPRGRPAAIDRDTLIATTLRIIDTEGIEAVTMRRLAAELNTSPMAPYRHVASKEELLQVAAAALVDDITIPVPGTPWQDALQTFFESFHDRLLDHPGVARLFGGQAFLSDTVYAVADPVFTILIEAGFDAQTAVSLFMACASCSIGAAVLEAAAAAQQDGTAGDDLVVVVAAKKYPGIAAVAPYLPARERPGSYSKALRNLIAGYAATLQQPTAESVER
ncbi:TetR family transcriptional regulator [Nocardia sp. NPDC059246]|uniref:TetR family transcriptional regulator n=1 Tax=unclassified Nocardia TaxID=2637762 RepID=UPI0036A65DCA